MKRRIVFGWAMLAAFVCGAVPVPEDARDDYFINRDNYRLFCNSNEDLLKGSPRGIVIEFPGLGGGSCLGGRQDPMGAYTNSWSKFPETTAAAGLVHVYLMPGPWSWMNPGAVREADLVIDALHAKFGLAEGSPLIAAGGSMGGLGALVFTAWSRHKVTACASACPCYDALAHYHCTPSFARTYLAAVAPLTDRPLVEGLKAISPVHLLGRMPDIPYFIVCDEKDHLFPAAGMDAYVGRLRAAGRNVEYVKLPGKGHGEFTPECRARLHAFVCGDVKRPASGVSAAERPAVRFADGWRLACDRAHVGLTNGWARVAPAGTKAVTMPYCSAAEDPDCGEVWLYRTFRPTPPSGDERVFLELGGVTYLCTAWLNGERLGEHRGSYGDFSFDVTRLLRPGEDNLLVLNVKCPTDNFKVEGNNRLQSPVWKSFPRVQRVPTLRRHGAVALTGAFLRPDWKSGAIAGRLAFDAKASRASVAVTVQVREHKKDAVLAECRMQVPVAAGKGEVALPSPVNVPGFRLWSPDDPSFYDVTVRADGEELQVRTGFRDLRVDDSGYFALNGRRVFLKCTHMASEYPDAIDIPVHLSEMYRTLMFLKISGFNMIRFINCPAYPEVIDLCDEIGLMMYEEHPMAWTKVAGKDSAVRFCESVSELLLRDRHHPSLTVFGLLNETENVPEKVVFNDTARDRLPAFRALAPDILFMYHSGRWDAKRDIASASNPGSAQWDAWMGDEAAGAPPEPCKKPKDGMMNHAGRGDIHLYPRLPLDEREWGYFHNLTRNNRRASFVSESGYGSMANVLEGYLLVAQNGHSRKHRTYPIVERQVRDLRKAFDDYGLYAIWPTPEEMIKESQAASAAKRAALTTMIRRCPKVNGYSVTMAQDLNYYGEGLLETSGGAKRGMVDMLEEQLADLRFCVTSTNLTLYAGRKFPLEVALSDFGTLKRGTDYPIALRVAGADGIVWRRDLVHRVRIAADGQPEPVSVLFAGEIDTAGWKPGRYTVAAEILEGAHADCGTLAFTLADPAAGAGLKGRTIRTINGVHPNVTGFFKRNGAKVVDVGFDSLPADGVLFVGWENLPDEKIDALVEAARRGAKVVFLQPEAISKKDGTGVPRRMPFAAGRLKRTNNWLYHADSIVFDSPLTAGLPRRSILETDFYGRSWGDIVFLGCARPDLSAIMSAYVGFGGRDQSECEIGVQLGAYRVGKGWIVLNTLRLDLSGGEPAADLLLRNLCDFR